MKYKLINSLPGVPQNSIGVYKDNAVEFIIENTKTCFPIDPEEHKDWFAQYVFTTEDEVDIYEGEECYVITKDNNVEWLMAVHKSEIDLSENSYFYSHDKANEYRREGRVSKVKESSVVEAPITTIETLSTSSEEVIAIHNYINPKGDKMILTKEEASLLVVELNKFINK